jgi:hypothetical protein
MYVEGVGQGRRTYPWESDVNTIINTNINVNIVVIAICS